MKGYSIEFKADDKGYDIHCEVRDPDGHILPMVMGIDLHIHPGSHKATITVPLQSLKAENIKTELKGA